MSGLRDEITKRFLRLKEADPGSAKTESSSSEETSVPTDPREGRQFGAYRILRRLGSGGMGHVYLALDTRLGRHTALKFLPPELLSNQEMLRRLQQEARTASALNHPNILTIYEIGEFAGEPFIASEFVEGVTLKRAIRRGAVDPDMAIRIAAQIASALGAAHAAGIIHRDLKPANVMLRPDGYVKVIDFGLAKIAGESATAARSDWSALGAVVGTVDYMSPEQARGEEVDQRTDLWSLGVLLYEMLSSQRPFSGETDSHVIVAILDRPAPPLPRAASLPAGCSAIVARALSKEPARRYQSAQQMLSDLERLDTSSMRRLAVRPLRAEQRRARHYLLIALVPAGLLLAAAGLWWWGFGGKELFLEPDWFRVESVRQVTFNGRTLLAAISPDGKYLAFVVGDSGGMQSLHLKQVDQPSDEVRIPARKIDYIGLTFTPDSRTVYEVEEDESTLLGCLFAVPVVGDRSTRPILEDIDGPVTFSPRGDRFAYVRWENSALPAPGPTRSVIEMAEISDPKPAALFSLTGLTLHNHLSWSFDGTEIAGIADNPAKPLQLEIIRPDGSEMTKQFPNWNSVGQLCWRRGERLLLLTAASETEAHSRSQLREFSVATGKARNLTNDLSGYGSISLTQDESHLAAVKKDARATVWLSSPKDLTHGQSVLSESLDSASLAWLDTGHLLVNSRRTGFPNLAVLDTSDKSESILTDEPFVEQHAVPVPGADAVVYSSNRAGGFHLWRHDLRSNKYMQLTFGAHYDDSPVISPDGRWIVYTSWSANTPFLYKISSQRGGSPIRVGSYSAADPQISPDGKWVACRIQPQRDRVYVGLIPFDSAGPIRLVPKARVPFRWSPRGDSLTSSITDATGISNIWRIPLNGSAPRELTDFDDEQTILTFAWSATGDRLACLRLAHNSDVVLFKRQAGR